MSRIVYTSLLRISENILCLGHGPFSLHQCCLPYAIELSSDHSKSCSVSWIFDPFECSVPIGWEFLTIHVGEEFETLEGFFVADGYTQKVSLLLLSTAFVDLVYADAYIAVAFETVSPDWCCAAEDEEYVLLDCVLNARRAYVAIVMVCQCFHSVLLLR